MEQHPIQEYVQRIMSFPIVPSSLLLQPSNGLLLKPYFITTKRFLLLI